MGFLMIILALTTPILLISILTELKKYSIIAENSNLQIKEFNTTAKFLKRKFRESSEFEKANKEIEADTDKSDQRRSI